MWVDLIGGEVGAYHLVDFKGDCLFFPGGLEDYVSKGRGEIRRDKLRK